MTIVETAIEVLKMTNRVMSVNDIYNYIIEHSLYSFHALDPLSVLRVELRRHSIGIDFPTASPKKFFIYDQSNGGFSLIGKKEIVQTRPLMKLKRMYDEYLLSFKKNLLSQLKEMDPFEFEHFCMSLLGSYGFSDVQVTKKSNDGGIDGYGKLKVGLAFMNVAFQCKRWNETKVGRVEIDTFRGAIQGEFEQGLYFTTSSFTENAAKKSIKPGAVPIVLIDGEMIVDFMMKNEFGVEHDDLPIFVNAIDKIFS